jgi:hypothetical protein
MSTANVTEIEQRIGSEISHFIYRVPKKNHVVEMRVEGPQSPMYDSSTVHYGIHPKLW